MATVNSVVKAWNISNTARTGITRTNRNKINFMLGCENRVVRIWMPQKGHELLFFNLAKSCFLKVLFNVPQVSQRLLKHSSKLLAPTLRKSGVTAQSEFFVHNYVHSLSLNKFYSLYFNWRTIVIQLLLSIFWHHVKRLQSEKP